MTIKNGTTEPNRICLIVEKGSVVTKPDYVDLVEVNAGCAPPIVVHVER